jgi:methionyl-tRNA synthetase
MPRFADALQLPALDRYFSSSSFMNTATSSYIVTLPPPTPNGGLHVGHMSGPFLAGDVFAKAARLRGVACFTTCYSDVNQSYVRVTAERQNRDPHELAAHWTHDIKKTLLKYGVELSDYFAPDATGTTYVRDLFVGLYERGVLKKKPFPVFYSQDTHRYLDEAGVSGICPVCLAACKCGICEACGSLTDATTLLEPRVTVGGSTNIEVVYVEVMVLELERLRPQIEAFYATNRRFRTRYLWLVEDALRAKLPDFPVTLPGSWGIQVDHRDFPGQTINAWPELMAELIYSYCRALDQDSTLGQAPAFVNFFGFDNSYFYALVHLALLTQIDDGRWLPHATIINEFYNLDHAKFSTSNNHSIWSSDLTQRHSVDAIRFYAAFNAPGFEKANFNEGDMVKVVDERLLRPWTLIASGYNVHLARGANDGTFKVSAQARMLGEAALHRIFDSYSLERFHLRQAAEDLLHLFELIAARVTSLCDGQFLGDVAYLLKCFALAAFPLMPFGSAALYEVLTGQPLTRLDFEVPTRAGALPEWLFETASMEPTETRAVAESA